MLQIHPWKLMRPNYMGVKSYDILLISIGEEFTFLLLVTKAVVTYC
jgi:hypothetical protein